MLWTCTRVAVGLLGREVAMTIPVVGVVVFAGGGCVAVVVLIGGNCVAVCVAVLARVLVAVGVEKTGRVKIAVLVGVGVAVAGAISVPVCVGVGVWVLPTGGQVGVNVDGKGHVGVDVDGKGHVGEGVIVGTKVNIGTGVAVGRGGGQKGTHRDCPMMIKSEEPMQFAHLRSAAVTPVLCPIFVKVSPLRTVYFTQPGGAPQV